MKILVTGGAGFIGSHVSERLLNEGHQVISIDNFNSYYDPLLKRRNVKEIRAAYPDRFISVEADIRNAEAITRTFREQEPEAVIHLAAMAGVRPSIEDPALYMDVNMNGTQVILDACRLQKITNFIFASSSSVYGNNKKVPFSETDNVDNPISPYAATKKAGELLCHAYAHLFGINIVCLRFFTVYGPRQRPDLAIRKFTELLYKGGEIPFYGTGNTRRDYTFIGDIVDGVTKALFWNASQNPGNYAIFNLGESHTISLAEMVACLEKVTKRKASLKRLPAQPGDVEITYADVTKAKEILGYDPRTSFESGVEIFVSWLLAKENIHA